MGPLLELRRLKKRYAYRPVLDGVDLDVAPGETVALLGPNGAGKSTLLKIAATLVRPDEGQVRVLGVDARRARAAVRRRISYLGHETMVNEVLTALENLRFFAALEGLDRADARADRALARVGLWRRRHDPVRDFSRGMVQRLAVARTLLAPRDVYFFDEPMTGLDHAARKLMGEITLEASRRGAAVLFTHHDVEESWRMAGRAVLLFRGVVAEDRPRSERPAFDAAYHRVMGEPSAAEASP